MIGSWRIRRASFTGVDAIEIGPHFLQATLGHAQHGQPVVAEQQGPGIDVGQGVIEHGLAAFKRCALIATSVRAPVTAGKGGDVR